MSLPFIVVFSGSVAVALIATLLELLGTLTFIVILSYRYVLLIQHYILY